MIEKRTRKGGWICIDNDIVVRMMLKADFDYLVFDFEHSTFDLSKFRWYIDLGESTDVPIIARVPKEDFKLAFRLLEMGIHGIVFSTVDSLNYAEEIFKTCFYREKGNRGLGLNYANEYGASFDKYYHDSFKIPIYAQIESVRGISLLPELINYSFSGFMIGPYDLSCSLGEPGVFDSPAFRESLATFENTISKTSADMMYHLVHPNQKDLVDLYARGYNNICLGTDFEFLKAGINLFK